MCLAVLLPPVHAQTHTLINHTACEASVQFVWQPDCANDSLVGSSHVRIRPGEKRDIPVPAGMKAAKISVMVPGSVALWTCGEDHFTAMPVTSARMDTTGTATRRPLLVTGFDHRTEILGP